MKIILSMREREREGGWGPIPKRERENVRKKNMNRRGRKRKKQKGAVNYPKKRIMMKMGTTIAGFIEGPIFGIGV